MSPRALLLPLLLVAASACRPVGEFHDTPVELGVAPDAGIVARTELDGSRLVLRTDFAARVSDCSGACVDADGDGLVDAWEDLVLERFRPIQRFDENEPLVGDDTFVLADVGRVKVVSLNPLLVRVFTMLGYKYDYGACGQTAHDGDSERVGIELEGIAPGKGDVRVVRAYTAAHEGAQGDHSHVFPTDELSQLRFVQVLPLDEPRWVVFPSSAKHGTYANPERCEQVLRAPCFAEFCNPDVKDAARFNRLPPVFNAGEEDKPRLTDLGAIGFPGDDAWKDQEFCGGSDRTKECSSAVREKLLRNPFDASP